ncbi:poly(A)-specific ribonuclease [Mucor ambiguus]|uniref:PAN2-PAN3 deadenylation complex subunit PAN3 n=1 Tax=Mucor ambiguus TaxID=91626 RepID=A0A0C9M1W0_9FUNG|nr:poly(A)-specific ribonuclease [Mucor ambiguus]
MNPHQPSNPITHGSSGISIKSPSATCLSENQDTTATKPAPKTIPSSSSSSKRTCRNVIIHGFCKFQDKGCEFNHDAEKPIVLPQQLVNHSTSPETSRNSSVSAGSIHAPVFVPKSTQIQEKASPPRPILTNMYHNTDSANARLTSPIQQSPHNRFPFVNGQHYMYPQQQQQHPSTPMMPQDPYFYMNNHHPFPQPSQTQYHQYAPSLPHVANLQNHQRLVQSFFIPDNLKEQLLKRNDATVAAAASAKETGLPEQVHVYHSLYRMEDKPGKVLGHPSWVYKAMCRTNGKYYTMVRIEGFRLVNEQAMNIVKQWRKIKHANIVAIREAFTTRAFGDSSLVFVYDYHPCSITLFEAYFSPQAQALLHARFQAAGINGMPVPETTLWSFITQMASALKTIHSAGLSARTMEPTKIIMTSKNRLRISCAGLVDVLQFDTTTQQAQRATVHQQEDLLSFGKLIVSLACNSPTPTNATAATSVMPSFEYMSRFYSPDLKNVAYYLLGKPALLKSIDEVFTMIGPRLLHELNSSQYYTDTLEANLSNELENSRLVKLMSKLNFINERPEFEKDPRWQETGDRYMIKLFRDYIFHQVNEMGVPVVDMGHVIACINKLDTGADESIMLTSREDQTSIIVTYKELKSCIASAFNEINTKAHSTTHGATAGNKKK